MTTKTELLRIIRRHCLTCCGESAKDVDLCRGDVVPCGLWPFRFGKDPLPSPGKVNACRKNMAVYRAKKASNLGEK